VIWKPPELERLGSPLEVIVATHPLAVVPARQQTARGQVHWLESRATRLRFTPVVMPPPA
jgi:hypothetical protein